MARYSKTLWDTNTIYNPTNMNHIEQGIYDADLREGGEINGDLYIIKKGSTSAIGESIVSVGNNIAEGTYNNSRGRLRLYSNSTRYIEVIPSNDMTGNLAVRLPIPSASNKVLALREDAYKVLASVTPTANETNSQLLLRFQTALAEIGSHSKKMGIILFTVGGNVKIFRCGRFTSNNYMAYSCLYPAASAISVYNIFYGGSGSVSFYNMTQSADGFVRTNLGGDVAEGGISLISFVE